MIAVANASAPAAALSGRQRSTAIKASIAMTASGVMAGDTDTRSRATVPEGCGRERGNDPPTNHSNEQQHDIDADEERMTCQDWIAMIEPPVERRVRCPERRQDGKEPCVPVGGTHKRRQLVGARAPLGLAPGVQ
jgi:hypothetical protein